MFDDTKVAYIISRYTTANSNYKRHVINGTYNFVIILIFFPNFYHLCSSYLTPKCLTES